MANPDPCPGHSDDIWAGESDPEDVPTEVVRVRRDHSQAGYLEGVTQSKEQFLQVGFDTGYPIGADIGLAAGKIIGVLQGLGVEELLAKALQELSVKNMFSAAYWTADAIPRYSDVHPVIQQWQVKVDNALQIKRQGQLRLD